VANEISINGVFLEILGIGTLIKGKSGSGKSELTVRLIDRGHRFISDDVVIFKADQWGRIVGFRANEDLGFHIYIKGLGILDIVRIFGIGAVKESEVLKIILEISTNENLKISKENILNCEIPKISLPKHKSDVEFLEFLIKAFKLSLYGYNSEEDFLKKIRRMLKND
jgi:HPr kinase/phosphorylase